MIVDNKKTLLARDLSTILQEYCHAGSALDPVEFFDEDSNTYCLIDKVEITRDHNRETLQIKFHHKKEGK